jgi:hypothetical protein
VAHPKSLGATASRSNTVGVEGPALAGMGIFAGVAQIAGAVVAYELSSSDRAVRLD